MKINDCTVVLCVALKGTCCKINQSTKERRIIIGLIIHIYSYLSESVDRSNIILDF